MLDYASSHRGRFPPNVLAGASGPSQYWHSEDRIGSLVGARVSPSGNAGGGVLVCPEEERAWRSYAMNRWASSKVDVRNGLVRKLWSTGMPNSSQLLLITEAWTSSYEASVGYYSPATVGIRGNAAGVLFGRGTPFGAGPLWGLVDCELAYNRHRNGVGTGKEPVGRLNIGYADGHVETVSHDMLVDQATGLSTFHTLWSDMDFQYP